MKTLFLKGAIRPEATLVSSLALAKGLPGVNDSFGKFINDITSNVINKRSRAEILKVTQTWQVSTFHSDRIYGSGRGRGFREVLAEVDLVERLMDGAEVEGEIQTIIHMSIEAKPTFGFYQW